MLFKVQEFVEGGEDDAKEIGILKIAPDTIDAPCAEVIKRFDPGIKFSYFFHPFPPSEGYKRLVFYRAQSSPKPGFIMNQIPQDEAAIIIARNEEAWGGIIPDKAWLE